MIKDKYECELDLSIGYNRLIMTSNIRIIQIPLQSLTYFNHPSQVFSPFPAHPSTKTPH